MAFAWGKIALLAGAGLAFAGCSNRPPTTWEKAGASPDSMRADYNDCRRVAQRDARVRTASLGPPAYRGQTRLIESYAMAYRPETADRMYQTRRLTTLCMQNRGYTIAEEPEPATTARQ